jgi:hypothetical protein
LITVSRAPAKPHLVSAKIVSTKPVSAKVVSAKITWLASTSHDPSCVKYSQYVKTAFENCHIQMSRFANISNLDANNIDQYLTSERKYLIVQIF